MTQHEMTFEAVRDLDPRYRVECNGVPFVVTVGGNDEVNAKRVATCLTACRGINPEAVKGLLGIAERLNDILPPDSGGELDINEISCWLMDGGIDDVRAALAKAAETSQD